MLFLLYLNGFEEVTKFGAVGVVASEGLPPARIVLQMPLDKVVWDLPFFQFLQGLGVQV